MNTLQSLQEVNPSEIKSQCLVFGEKRMGQRSIVLGLTVIMSILIYLTMMLSQVTIVPMDAMTSEQVVANTLKDHETVSSRIKELKRLNLWQVTPETPVPLVDFKKFPADFDTVQDVRLRKKVFLHTLLPVAMIANHEVREERSRLLELIKKTGYSTAELVFTDEEAELRQRSWKSSLSAEELSFIATLSRKYRTNRADLLIKRVDLLPVSLILAQGAVESSWGRSRFAREGNNLFGMWTWSGKGMIPAQREDGKKHRVSTYDSILDSVRSYLLTLNRLNAYEPLRRIRLETSDSFALTEGLVNYSEKKQEYVASLQKVIMHNRLQYYDRLSLSLANRQNVPLRKVRRRANILTARNEIL